MLRCAQHDRRDGESLRAGSNSEIYLQRPPFSHQPNPLVKLFQRQAMADELIYSHLSFCQQIKGDAQVFRRRGIGAGESEFAMVEPFQVNWSSAAMGSKDIERAA